MADLLHLASREGKNKNKKTLFRVGTYKTKQH